MISTKNYEERKKKVINIFNKLNENLVELEDNSIDVIDVKYKVDSILQNISDDRVSIVLIGAFSDGKTTIASSLMNKKFENMKIDSDESTDTIEVYSNGDNSNYVFVDTPGLFGHKTLENNLGTSFYDKQTTEYLSRADVILYVVDAVNPVKNSHLETLKWIMLDLNKYKNMIFLINKMDEVTSLDDEEDFAYDANIKKLTMTNALSEAGIPDDILKDLNILCVAANPDGLGLEHWFNNLDEYNELSRVNAIHNKLKEILSIPENNLNIKIKTYYDSLNDIVSTLISKMEDFILPSIDDLRNADKNLNSMKQELSGIETEIKNTLIECDDEIDHYFKHLLRSVEALDRNNIESFVSEELGRKDNEIGYLITHNVEKITNKYLSKINKEINKFKVNIETEISKQDIIMGTISKRALGVVSKVPKDSMATLIKSGIFNARDLLGKYTNIAIKFKPWQVANLAKFSKFIGPAATVLGELIDLLLQYFENAKLEKIKKDLRTAIDDFRSLVLDMLKFETIINDNCESYTILKNAILESENDYNELKKQLADIEICMKKIEALKTEELSCQNSTQQ